MLFRVTDAAPLVFEVTYRPAGDGRTVVRLRGEGFDAQASAISPLVARIKAWRNICRVLFPREAVRP